MNSPRIAFGGVVLLSVFPTLGIGAETYLKGNKVEDRKISRSVFEQVTQTQNPSDKYQSLRPSATSQTAAGPGDGCFGACCDASSGSCVNDVYVYECTGTFSPSASCDDVACPPLGACCHLDSGECGDNVPISECPPFPDGDWWQGFTCGDIQCAEPILGACCEENFGTCVEGVTELNCIINSLLGTFAPNATCDAISCPSLGACCNSFASECTSESTLVACFNSGADTITLDHTCEEVECPDSGACCNFTGECSDDVPWFACDGTIWDPNVSCAELGECPSVPVGACCVVAAQTCSDGIPEINCLFGFGGTWHAGSACDQINCPPHGACCDADSNECTDDVAESACSGGSDLWFSNRLCGEVSCSADTSCGGVNQSFETGGFSGWVALDMQSPFFAMQGAGSGITTYPCFFETEPTQGEFAALHGWDGNGPDMISLSQEVSLPAGATVLRYDYRAAWLLTFGASLDRTFTVTLQPTMPGNPLWGPEQVLTAPAGGIQGDTGNKTGGIDVSALSGTDVRLLYEWFIPEPFVGPAQFQLDNVRCDSPVLNSGSYSSFASCLTGPGEGLPSNECTGGEFQESDAVGNGKVDLRDYRVLSIGFTP